MSGNCIKECILSGGEREQERREPHSSASCSRAPSRRMLLGPRATPATMVSAAPASVNTAVFVPGTYATFCTVPSGMCSAI